MPLIDVKQLKLVHVFRHHKVLTELYDTLINYLTSICVSSLEMKLIHCNVESLPA